MPPDGVEQGSVRSNISFLLTGWARRTKRGRVTSGETGLVIAKAHTVRGVDVAYFSYARLPRGFTQVAPELAVEVLGLDQDWRDLTDKAAQYLRMGVVRVWIVDPIKRTLHVLRSDGEPESYAARQTISDAAVLPGFSCRVSAFFED